jgi:hypothetical protein
VSRFLPLSRAARRCRSPDVVGLAHLWAMQFQHITTLAVAGGGGLLVLAQTDLVSVSGRWWVSLVLFALAALGAAIGQFHVVEEAAGGRSPGKAARIMVFVTHMCFGGSAYLLVRLILAG